MAAIENADSKFRGASLIDADKLEEVLAEAESSAAHAGPPGGHGGHRGPPGGRRGPPRGGPGGFNPVEMFDTQDANNDDKLTGDEIPDRMRQRLDDVDTDGDGEVSREEIEAMAERYRHGGPPRGPGGHGPPGGRGPGGPGGHGGSDADSQSDRPQRPE